MEMKTKVILKFVGHAGLYTASYAAAGYLACYGYVGHMPTHAWVIWVTSVVAGVIKGITLSIGD